MNIVNTVNNYIKVSMTGACLEYTATTCPPKPYRPMSAVQTVCRLYPFDDMSPKDCTRVALEVADTVAFLKELGREPRVSQLNSSSFDLPCVGDGL
jgi:hypothetical protein